MTASPKIPVSVITDHLPQFFKSYPKLGGVTPSSWIVYSEGGEKVHSTLAYMCHAPLYGQKGYDNLITAVPKSDEVSLAYQRMLISGPFKAVSDLVSLEQFDKMYFLHCSNLDKWPANLLYNFCIASRLPIEFKHLLPYWAELTEKGFDPTLAFLLSYSTNGKDLKERTYQANNHFWIDASSDWGRVLGGNPEKLSSSFKANPRDCLPCNVIWGHSVDYRKLSHMTNEEVSDFFGLPIEPVQELVAPPKVKIKKIPIDYDHLIAQAAQAGINQAIPVHVGGDGGGGADGIQPPAWLLNLNHLNNIGGDQWQPPPLGVLNNQNVNFVNIQQEPQPDVMHDDNDFDGLEDPDDDWQPEDFAVDDL